jgi:hypothetical protein
MTGSEPRSRSGEMRWLRRQGLTPGEAGNLIGLRDLALHPARSGWTLQELARVDFLRWLWETKPETRG